MALYDLLMLNVLGSTSTIIGVSPRSATTSAVATYVKAGQITSSPALNHTTLKQSEEHLYH